MESCVLVGVSEVSKEEADAVEKEEVSACENKSVDDINMVDIVCRCSGGAFLSDAMRDFLADSCCCCFCS